MSAERVRRPDPPQFALRGLLADLSELLLQRPRAPHPVLLLRVREAYRAVRDQGGESGLPHLVLRNLLADLMDRRVGLDTRYHAAQLARASERLPGRLEPD